MFRRKNRPKHRADEPPARIPWSAKAPAESGLPSLSLHEQIIDLKTRVEMIGRDERAMMSAFSTAVQIATHSPYRRLFNKHRYSDVSEILVRAHAIFADLQLGMNTERNILTKQREQFEDEIERRIANGETVMQIAQDVPVADDRPRPTVATGNETGTEVTVSFVNVRRPSPFPAEPSDTPDDIDTDDTSEESSSESHTDSDR